MPEEKRYNKLKTESKIFNKSGTNAELSLVKLSQLFNHSNVSTTRRYLGIAKEEMMQTYDLLGF